MHVSHTQNPLKAFRNSVKEVRTVENGSGLVYVARSLDSFLHIYVYVWVVLRVRSCTVNLGDALASLYERNSVETRPSKRRTENRKRRGERREARGPPKFITVENNALQTEGPDRTKLLPPKLQTSHSHGRYRTSHTHGYANSRGETKRPLIPLPRSKPTLSVSTALDDRLHIQISSD